MTETIELNQLFYQAGTLMLVGMAFVFAFLMLMIFIINNIITPLGAKFDNEPGNIQAQNTSYTKTENQPPPQVIAAISAAVKQYRSK